MESEEIQANFHHVQMVLALIIDNLPEDKKTAVVGGLLALIKDRHNSYQQSDVASEKQSFREEREFYYRVMRLMGHEGIRGIEDSD